METGGATAHADDSSMPTGVVAVCLLHLGLGGLLILGGLLSVLVPSGFRATFGGAFAVFLGVVVFGLGYELMQFRPRAWRYTILFHGIDAVVGLVWVLSDGIAQVIGPVVSVAVIVYLYSRRDLFSGDPDRSPASSST